MKLTLTITDASPSELAGLVAYLNGGSSAVALTAVTTATTGDDDGPANANAPSVDAAGLPWDERIHSKGKTLTDNGMWRKRKGVADATVTAVEAELRARVGTPIIPPTMQPPVAQQPAAMPTMQPPVAQQPAPVMTQPAAMPTMQPPIAQPVVPSAPQPDPVDFNGFMQRLTAIMQLRDGAGNPMVTADYLAGACAETTAAYQGQIALNTITDLGAFPFAIPYVVGLMKRDGRWQ